MPSPILALHHNPELAILAYALTALSIAVAAHGLVRVVGRKHEDRD